MNALTPRAASGAIAIPPHLPLPPLPAPVAGYLSALDAFAEDRRRFDAAQRAVREGRAAPETLEALHVTAPRLPSLSGAAADEAQRLAAAMEASLSPVSIGALRAWLAPVNAACRNPQTREDFEARLHGIHALCEDLPHGAFTADARKGLPEFFPSAADVRGVVEPGARKLRAAHHALIAAATPKPAPEPVEERGERTPGEIAYVKARAAEAKAALRAADEPAEARKVKPAYLSGEALAQFRNRSPVVQAARALSARVKA